MTQRNPPLLTPEGKRAAERVRLIFFSIAAANIVLVAIVMWSRHNAEKKRETPAPKPAAAQSTPPTAAR